MFNILGVPFADKGFFINLESSLDRKKHVDTQVQRFQITNLERFPALTDEMIQCTATKSQCAVFERALKENLDTVFVAEDDFILLEQISQYNGKKVDLRTHLLDLSRELNSLEWDVFLFGCTPKTHLIPCTLNTSLVHKSTGAWAYLIKRKAMQYILEHFTYKKDLLAIDDILPLLNFEGFKTLCATPITIHHASGFVSTLDPRGPVNYDSMINGHYQKFLENHLKTDYLSEYNLEQNLTIVIAGHFVDNFLFYIRYLLRSLPDSIKKCRFLIYYHRHKHLDEPVLDLIHYFYNRQETITNHIQFVNYGLIDTVKHMLQDIVTPYFLFLEHDWVFLQKDSIDFKPILKAFDTHAFINSVYFNKDDNQMRGFEICQDSTGKTTPFELEKRVKEINLITTCRWSNNPCIHRTSKYREWYATYLDSVHGNVSHGCHDVEEVIIPAYRKEIAESTWESVKDKWGTFLYGDLGQGPYVGHTDASRRYLTTSRSQPEINGETYIANNPLPKQD